MEDISKALVYEIKQDIANRYFGFRKQIEIASNQYLQGLQASDKDYTTKILLDMHRIHCLLQNNQLFRRFIEFTKLPEAIGSLYTDPKSPVQWRLLFAGLKGEGFTRKRRHRNLLYKVYQSLYCSIDAYRNIFVQLTEEHEEICKEIDRFYRMNDLSGILNFLREIDNPDTLRSGLLNTDRATLAGQNLEQDLRIVPPPAVTTRMHSLAQLPPLQAAKATLNQLIKEAFPLFDHCNIGKLPF